MEFILLVSIVISFICSLLVLPYWIKQAKKSGFIGKDMNKFSKNEVSEAGGIVIVGSFVLSILIYIAIKVFYFKSTENLIELLSILTSILIISNIGFLDDIIGWKIGLSKKARIISVVFAAIPLMVINAGNSTVFIPFFGLLNLGLLYPLFLIPIGIVGASTTFNFLAGYNGLEASQGILILTALSIVTFYTGNSWLSLISLCMVASLISFYIFNKFPSSIFPGDVLTYSIGSLIAIIAILGDIERIAVFFFIPYFIETILKLRGKLNKESFAKVNEDGSLNIPYEKFYGLEHISIFLLKKIKKSGKAYEKEVVYMINIFQILIICLGFFIFKKFIF